MKTCDFNESGYWERLREVGKKKGVKLRECCTTLEFPYQSILNMHQRHSFPPVDKLYKIACFYEVSIEWLLTGSSDNVFENKIEALEGKLKRISEIIQE